jgi:hypothetical protein
VNTTRFVYYFFQQQYPTSGNNSHTARMSQQVFHRSTTLELGHPSIRTETACGISRLTAADDDILQTNRFKEFCQEVIVILFDDSCIPVCVAAALRAATPHRAVRLPRMPKLERGGQVNARSMPGSTESPDYSRGYSSSRGELTLDAVRRECPMRTDVERRSYGRLAVGGIVALVVEATVRFRVQGEPMGMVFERSSCR